MKLQNLLNYEIAQNRTELNKTEQSRCDPKCWVSSAKKSTTKQSTQVKTKSRVWNNKKSIEKERKMFVNEKFLHGFSTCKWEFCVCCLSRWKRAANLNFVAKTMAISNNRVHHPNLNYLSSQKLPAFRLFTVVVVVSYIFLCVFLFFQLKSQQLLHTKHTTN